MSPAMTAGAAVVDIMQQLRGLVSELNKRDQPAAAMKAQGALTFMSELGDELDAWELTETEFAPVKSDKELAPAAVPDRMGPRRA